MDVPLLFFFRGVAFFFTGDFWTTRGFFTGGTVSKIEKIRVL